MQDSLNQSPMTEPANSIDVKSELAKLAHLTIHELRAKYRDLYGVPTMVAHKVYLQKRIIWKMQSIAENLDLSPEDWELVDLLSRNAPVRMKQMHKQIDDGIETMADESPEILDMQSQQDPRIPSENAPLDDIFDENETLESVLRELAGEKNRENESRSEKGRMASLGGDTSAREVLPDAEVNRQEPSTPTAGPFPQSTTQLELPQLEVGGDVSKIAMVIATPQGDLRIAFNLSRPTSK